jgi:hypothetical protein
MKSDLESGRVWPKIVAGAACGAAAMYILDPDRGRRRRAILRDKTRSSLGIAVNRGRMSARDIGHRLHGIAAVLLRLIRPGAARDDLVLIERVRAKIGRVVAHPHALHVGARKGRVVLSGPILASESDRLLKAVRSVWGVTDIEDHLLAYERPDSIPSLQGGEERGANRGRRKASWTAAQRASAIACGGALAGYALRQNPFAALALGTIAGGLAAKSAFDAPVYRLFGRGRTQDSRTAGSRGAQHTLASEAATAEEGFATAELGGSSIAMS